MASNENEFNSVLNFPHCVGTLDGKHVVVRCPPLSGSDFYNYKGTFSIVLSATVDANYNFIFVNTGCQGRTSDGGVFRNTSVYRKLMNNSLHLPQGTQLPGRTKEVSYVFVADDAFTLHSNILKSHPGYQIKRSMERIFNYRMSRARMVVENVFGILSSVFRVLRKPILLDANKAQTLLDANKAQIITLACVYLHNFLRRNVAARST
jgi:hypothetical protein